MGEIRADADLEVLVEALWGPIFHRLLVSHMQIDKRFIDRLLDLVLAGVMPGVTQRQGSGLQSRTRAMRSAAMRDLRITATISFDICLCCIASGAPHARLPVGGRPILARHISAILNSGAYT